MKPIIKVEGLSKMYRLGQVGTGSIAHDVNRWWHKVRGKEDPYIRIGETNDRSQKGSSEYVWALKDINFEVQPGEVLGIIGRNGAGKSTLLKILSRTTAPTTGSVKIKGRVASLLEVGTGFHPDLTGRDNIFLNGAILGMTRREIQSKFDEIVDFAGVERYIDTPVKRYSSGMYVRLAFAVAAHLEPEILIVDEVLAVGDAEFQKKCLGKMKDVSDRQGRTVLFVSHNMGAIKTLCNSGILMKNGMLELISSTQNIIDGYLKTEEVGRKSHFVNEMPRKDSDILEIKITNEYGESKGNFGFDELVTVDFKIKIAKEHLDFKLGVRVKDQLERSVFTSEVTLSEYIYKQGVLNIKLEIPSKVLVPNTYQLVVGLHNPNVEVIQLLDGIVQYTIEETGTNYFQYSGNDYGCVFVKCKWVIP